MLSPVVTQHNTAAQHEVHEQHLLGTSSGQVVDMLMTVWQLQV